MQRQVVFWSKSGFMATHARGVLWLGCSPVCPFPMARAGERCCIGKPKAFVTQRGLQEGMWDTQGSVNIGKRPLLGLLLSGAPVLAHDGCHSRGSGDPLPAAPEDAALSQHVAVEVKPLHIPHLMVPCSLDHWAPSPPGLCIQKTDVTPNPHPSAPCTPRHCSAAPQDVPAVLPADATGSPSIVGSCVCFGVG